MSLQIEEAFANKLPVLDDSPSLEPGLYLFFDVVTADSPSEC